MKRFFFVSLLLFIFHAIDAQASDWYVRPSGGSGAGTSWTAAWNGMNGINWNSVACGDTIWVAGGTYTQSLSPAKNCTSGSQLYIRRARSDASQCTGAAGWSSGFDSTVLQDNSHINFNAGATANYITVSGRTTASGGGYGWKVYWHNVTEGYGIGFIDTSIANYVTMEYIEVAGPTNHAWTAGDARGVDDSPYNGSNSHHTFSHMSVHDWATGFFATFGSYHTYEYIDMYNIASDSNEHPNLFYIKDSQHGIIRYSKFHNSSASGTGIAFSDQTYPYDDWQIYGNLFYDMMDRTPSAIGIQNQPITNLKIFNNTFSNNYMNINISAGAGCGTGCETRNNIFHGSGGSFSCGTTSNNLTTSNDGIFVNRAAQNLHIVSTIGSGYPRNAGTSLSSNFATDMGGTTFGGDGAWDIGAYEYSSTYATRPSAPSNLFIN